MCCRARVGGGGGGDGVQTVSTYRATRVFPATSAVAARDPTPLVRVSVARRTDLQNDLGAVVDFVAGGGGDGDGSPVLSLRSAGLSRDDHLKAAQL